MLLKPRKSQLSFTFCKKGQMKASRADRDMEIALKVSLKNLRDKVNAAKVVNMIFYKCNMTIIGGLVDIKSMN